VTPDDLREIGVGMLGYAFMGKAHSNAFRKLGYIMWPPPLRPRLVAIAGRNEEAVAEAARRYGFDRWTTQWQELVADPEIGLVDNLGPNDVHAAPTIAAAEAGKHVVCEKPLGRDADESYEIWRRVAATGVKHMCAFNYRFVASLFFDMEHLNELQVFRADGDRGRGFKSVLVTEPDHPFWEHWWPPGHIVGWGDTFVHELHHILAAIAGDTEVAPHGATFEDGYRAAEVCDAVVRSSESGSREAVTYRIGPETDQIRAELG
jgi:predicted dehydrogenase